jgi:type IV pilus assembly protein PilV
MNGKRPIVPRARARAGAPRLQQGVMLLEALVAILIFSIGILAVMGMQAASISQVTQSKFRTDASYLANQIIGRMWVDQANLAAYGSVGSGPRAAWDDTVAATLPGGVGDIDVNGTEVTVTINWQMPDDIVVRRYVAVANINPS